MSLADDLNDFVEQVDTLEIQLRDLNAEYEEMTKDYNTLEGRYTSLSEEYDEIFNELQWYRAAFPEGEKAYQVVERIEA